MLSEKKASSLIQQVNRAWSMKYSYKKIEPKSD